MRADKIELRKILQEINVNHCVVRVYANGDEEYRVSTLFKELFKKEYIEMRLEDYVTRYFLTKKGYRTLNKLENETMEEI